MSTAESQQTNDPAEEEVEDASPAPEQDALTAEIEEALRESESRVFQAKKAPLDSDDIEAIRLSYEEQLEEERRKAGQRVAIVILLMMLMLIPLFASL